MINLKINGNIMWMSDSFNSPSGFGQQTFHSVSRLTTGKNPIHVDNIAWQFNGNPVLLNDYWRVLPTSGRFAVNVFPHHVKIYKPDLVITLADLWNVQYIVNRRRPYDFKWLHWMPIDGEPLRGSIKWVSSYNDIDVMVAMSDFGEELLTKARKAYEEKWDVDIPTQIEKNYHGIPTDIFYPYDEETRRSLRTNYDWQDDFFYDTEIRKAFVKGEKDLNDYFIFGVVARNQIRKNYPELIQAWAEFAKDRDDVLLWLHTAPGDSGRKVVNLWYLVDQLGCADSVIFSDSVSSFYGMASKKMADVYNLFDCHFLATAGEGFGIPTIEAMACGVFTAVTDFTTGTELIDEGRCGYIIPHRRLVVSPGAVMRAYFNPDELVVDMENVYNMSESSRAHAKSRGRRRVIKKYNIDITVTKWRQLIDKYMHDAPTPRVDHEVDIKLHFDVGYMESREREAQMDYSKNEWRKIGTYLEEEDSVLDIGVGSGEGILFYSRHYGVRCTGSDVSDEALKMCRRKGLNVYKHDANTPLNHDDESFDVVLSQHVIEHLDDDLGPILESLRVAKKLAIHVIPHDNMVDKSHQRRYTREEIDDLVDSIVYSTNYGVQVTVHENRVGDIKLESFLVSYILVFKKV